MSKGARKEKEKERRERVTVPEPRSNGGPSPARHGAARSREGSCVFFAAARVGRQHLPVRDVPPVTSCGLRAPLGASCLCKFRRGRVLMRRLAFGLRPLATGPFRPRTASNPGAHHLRSRSFEADSDYVSRFSRARTVACLYSMLLMTQSRVKRITGPPLTAALPPPCTGALWFMGAIGLREHRLLALEAREGPGERQPLLVQRTDTGIFVVSAAASAHFLASS